MKQTTNEQHTPTMKDALDLMLSAYQYISHPDVEKATANFALPAHTLTKPMKAFIDTAPQAVADYADLLAAAKEMLIHITDDHQEDYMDVDELQQVIDWRAAIARAEATS